MKNKLAVATRGGLGDCLMMTPAIKSLKLSNPGKELWVFCIVQAHYEILLDNIYIDSLLVGENGIKIMQDNFPDGAIIYCNPPDLFPSLNNIQKRYSEIYCDMFKTPFLGDNLQLFISTNEENLFFEKGFIKGDQIITVNPTSRCSKNQEWDWKKWEYLVRKFSNYEFIQIGLKEEKLINGAIDYRGELTLRESCIAVKNSILYIGVDSFFSHVASAFNTNSITLFGDSSPNIYSHDNSHYIYKSFSCSPCNELLNGRECPYNKKCMHSITENEVEKVMRKKLESFGY